MRLDQRGLAAARFAGEAVDLVAVDVQADVVDGAHLALDAEVVHQVIGAQVVDRQHGPVAGVALRRSWAQRSSAVLPCGEAAARIDIFVHRDREQEQPDERS